jgi:hypothetical protein
MTSRCIGIEGLTDTALAKSGNVTSERRTLHVLLKVRPFTLSFLFPPVALLATIPMRRKLAKPLDLVIALDFL